MKIEIYKITNIVNKKVYIGQTTNLSERWNNHCTSKGSVAVSCAIQKYGKDKFTIESIGVCWSRGDVDRIEKEFIKSYKKKVEVYNRSEGGDGGIGFKHSEETKQKMSKTRKSIVVNWGDKISDGLKCHVVSQKTRDKISLDQRGRKRSPEFVEKMRNTLKGRVITWGNKISESLVGRSVSQETRDKIAESLRGRTQTKEAVDKRTRMLRGKTRNQEIRSKMCQAWVERRKPLMYKLLGKVLYEV